MNGQFISILMTLTFKYYLFVGLSFIPFETVILLIARSLFKDNYTLMETIMFDISIMLTCQLINKWYIKCVLDHVRSILINHPYLGSLAISGKLWVGGSLTIIVNYHHIPSFLINHYQY